MESECLRNKIRENNTDEKITVNENSHVMKAQSQ